MRAAILGIIEISPAQEFQKFNKLIQRVRADYLGEKEICTSKSNQSGINPPETTLKVSQKPIIDIKKIRTLVELERAKEKQSIERKIISEKEKFKRKVKEDQRRTRAWVRQLPSTRATHREHKRRLLLQEIEKAKELTPVTRSLWLNWGRDRNYITQEDCEKYQQKLRRDLEANISSCRQEISQLEKSLKAKGL